MKPLLIQTKREQLLLLTLIQVLHSLLTSTVHGIWQKLESKALQITLRHSYKLNPQQQKM